MIFHTISKECYTWLQKQKNVKEESLTDWMLYSISEKTNKFYYKTFTRNEESSNGADWEWWVLTDSYYGFSAYRFLIQAKKLKAGQDNYPLISYGNKNGLQIDLLIHSAQQRNAMPLYIYYSVQTPDIIQQINNFRFIDESIVTWCEHCTNGVYLSAAQNVKENIFGKPRRKISEVELLNNSLGLSMCDLLILNGKYPPHKIMDLINQYYLRTLTDKSPTESWGIEHNKNMIPRYLEILIERNQEQIDWFEDEFKYDIGNLSGIAVTDLRSK